ncbi:class I SAM-dependent methyltransferase [Actinoplanes derwentensis]|uniref:Methyltransferase domain-containing protein n=1 Tax=Actinoplanes derwentensis TaxID=113562 RepID=A0A1H2AGS2_9ACTN|nr:class I SAM-dependent methyltransferase [Actinoplanes derwentensis]GID90260.1 methyltransferase type 11 [Actinoplanes derwentensis]SDT45104.1 Methyltransferase domain-containing protein [Actinoplanes derwentensis]
MTTELRRIFDTEADRYDRVRPTYPPEIFEDLAAAGAPPPASVLEIGPGTGKATVPLAERGHRVTAVELGPALAEVARRNLAAFPRVLVEVCAFEEWPLPVEPFDVVLAATAFHWIDPRVRIEKSADALRPGGLLATVTTHHIAGGTAGFFARVQEHYERWDPKTDPDQRLRPAAEIPVDDAEILESDRFQAPIFHRYEWDATYSTGEYLDLLLTYSPTRSLSPSRRAALLAAIGRQIDEDHGGRIVKRYLSELRLARRG